MRVVNSVVNITTGKIIWGKMYKACITTEKESWNLTELGNLENKYIFELTILSSNPSSICIFSLLE